MRQYLKYKQTALNIRIFFVLLIRCNIETDERIYIVTIKVEVT